VEEFSDDVGSTATEVVSTGFVWSCVTPSSANPDVASASTTITNPMQRPQAFMRILPYGSHSTGKQENTKDSITNFHLTKSSVLLVDFSLGI
jgi:hypothetical protein